MALQLYHPEDARTSESTFEVMAKAFNLADKLAQTEFVPAGLRNRPAAVAAAMLVGHEVGLPPMTSLAHIHIIDGRPSMSAAIMRGLVLAHGHRIWVEEQTITRATVCSQRRGEERVLSSTWTIDDAKRANLSGKPNWMRYPRNMLIARATGDNARGNFMDVLGGIAYTTEELEDGDIVDAETPPSGGEAPKSGPEPRRRQARAAATAAVIVEPPTPPPGPEPEPIADSVPLAVGTEALPTPPEEEEDGSTPSPAVPPTEPAPEAAGPTVVAEPQVPEQPSSSSAASGSATANEAAKSEPAAAGEPLPAGPVEGAYWTDPNTDLIYKFTNGGWHAQTGPTAERQPPQGPPGDASPAAELSIAQQVAIACREAGVDRAALIQAVTGKASARELTRPEAVEVRDVAKKIGRGEALLEMRSDTWIVVQL